MRYERFFYVLPFRIKLNVKKQKEKIVGISLDGVLRNITGTFERIYTRMYPERTIKRPVNMFNILDSFPFESKEEMNEFVMSEALIIFGRAEEMRRNAMDDLNKILPQLKEKGYRVILLSKESGKTKGGTHVFLGDKACEVNEIRFVDDNQDFWRDIDILVTANPEIIALKPKGKKALVYNNHSLNKELRHARRIYNIKDILTKLS